MKQFTFKKPPQKATTFKTEGLSLTVPGMAINVRDQLIRLQRGEPIERMAGVYASHAGIEIPEFEKMSRLEKLDWAAQHREQLQETKERILHQLRETEKQKHEKEKTQKAATDNSGDPESDNGKPEQKGK